MSRLQPFVVTDWKILLRPRVGEGRNTMVRRGRWVNPVSESVHDRFSSSKVIEEQSKGHRHEGEERRVSRGPATPCHVRKMAMLYAYVDALVRSGEWPILVPFPFPKTEFVLRPLHSGRDRWQN